MPTTQLMIMRKITITLSHTLQLLLHTQSQILVYDFKAYLPQLSDACNVIPGKKESRAYEIYSKNIEHTFPAKSYK